MKESVYLVGKVRLSVLTLVVSMSSLCINPSLKSE